MFSRPACVGGGTGSRGHPRKFTAQDHIKLPHQAHQQGSQNCGQVLRGCFNEFRMGGRCDVMLCTQPFSHSPLSAGFHWLRAVSVMFEVNVAVHIHKWEHVMVFGEDDPSRARIAVWKSDAETHFEPLVPLNCKRWRFAATPFPN